MNSIKSTIEGIEKSTTEYKVHLDGDIHCCYYSNHFEDLVKLLEKNVKGIQAHGNISVKRSKTGFTIEGKDQSTSITLKNVVLENLLKR